MSPAEKLAAAQGRTEKLDLGAIGKPSKAGPMAKKKHDSGLPALDHGSRPLSKKQRMTIGRLGSMAYKKHADLGLIDPEIKCDAWRHSEQLSLVGHARLADCRQHHYRPLRGHFNAILRGDASAFADLTADALDADRQVNSQMLREALARLAQASNPTRKAMGEQGAERYALKIAGDRAKGRPPGSVYDIANTWPPQKIEALAYTLLNRARAIEKVGSTKARNKGQRRR